MAGVHGGLVNCIKIAIEPTKAPIESAARFCLSVRVELRRRSKQIAKRLERYPSALPPRAKAGLGELDALCAFQQIPTEGFI